MKTKILIVIGASLLVTAAVIHHSGNCPLKGAVKSCTEAKK
jgi:hypothetical protein